MAQKCLISGLLNCRLCEVCCMSRMAKHACRGRLWHTNGQTTPSLQPCFLTFMSVTAPNIKFLPYSRRALMTLFAPLSAHPRAMLLHSGFAEHSHNRFDILVAQPRTTLTTRGAGTEIESDGVTTYSMEDPFSCCSNSWRRKTGSRSLTQICRFRAVPRAVRLRSRASGGNLAAAGRSRPRFAGHGGGHL